MQSEVACRSRFDLRAAVAPDNLVSYFDCLVATARSATSHADAAYIRAQLRFNSQRPDAWPNEKSHPNTHKDLQNLNG